MNPQFGIAMQGCGKAILDTIDSRIDENIPFVYVELGIAEGRTLSAVARHILQRTKNFYCMGVDIEDGWSLNMDQVKENIKGLEDYVVIFLTGSTHHLNDSENHSIDFLLIDACHARECCARDFLDAVPKIKPGGFVAFHDTAPFAQGIQPQPHCNQPCNVLGSLEDLGLLSGIRPGWKLHWEVTGEEGGENHGLMIFKKE